MEWTQNKNYKSLRDYTNKELFYILNNNESIEFYKLPGLLSEILRRMHEKSPILEDHNNE